MVKKITIVDVLEPFLSRPGEELHLAEISRLMDEPHPTIRQQLNALQKRGILIKSNKGRMTLYKLNLDNHSILNYLIIAEKAKLIKKCENSLLLDDLVNRLSSILGDYSLCLIFGSAVDDFESAEDIDLLVIGKIEPDQIKSMSSRIDKEIHLIKVQGLSKISKSLKEEVIKKHLMIKGGETLLRWFLWQG